MKGVKQHQSNTNFSELCWICLSRFPDRILQPCKHVVCDDCIKKLSNIAEDQVPISLEGLSIEDSPSNEKGETHDSVIRSDCCPICSVNFTNCESNLRQREVLRDRFLHLVSGVTKK
jgi:hypothetical protein